MTQPVTLPPPPPKPIQPVVQRAPDPVPAAVNRIKDALSQGFLDWDVGHGDLINARGALDGLSPSQVNDVIKQLPDDTLRGWNSEMNGMRGALSAGEKTDQLNFLAQNLAPDQLARVSQQFRFGNDAQTFASAVGRFRDAGTVGDFAKRVMETPDPKNTTAWTNNANLAANAVGELNSPAKLTTALNTLSSDQRAKMLTDTSWAPKGVETTAFNKLTDTIARYGSLAQRTEAFSTISQDDAKFRDDNAKVPFSSQDYPALNGPYAAMKKLFATDPRGMTQLMSSQQPGMQPLTNFVEVAVIKGDVKQVGEWGLAVRRGESIPGADQTDLARFNHDFNRDPNGFDYRNAALSGAFTGAAMAAAINVNADAGKRQDLAMSLVTGGLGVAGSAIPGGGIVVGVGTTIGTPIAKNILAEAGKGREDFFNAIRDAGMPRDANGALAPIGSGGRVAFNAAAAEVLDAHGYR